MPWDSTVNIFSNWAALSFLSDISKKLLHSLMKENGSLIEFLCSEAIKFKKWQLIFTKVESRYGAFVVLKFHSILFTRIKWMLWFITSSYKRIPEYKLLPSLGYGRITVRSLPDTHDDPLSKADVIRQVRDCIWRKSEAKTSWIPLCVRVPL